MPQYGLVRERHARGDAGEAEADGGPRAPFAVAASEEGGDFKLFGSKDSPHNKCYVIVDAVKKYVTVVYLPFGGSCLF